MKFNIFLKSVLCLLVLFITGSTLSFSQNIFPTGTSKAIHFESGYVKLHKPNTFGGWATGVYDISNANILGGFGLMGVGNDPAHYFLAHGSNPWSSRLGLYVKANGNVGIGTTVPQYRLDVCGTIRGKEIFVEDDWCDYVFDEDYELPTIEEEKEHIECRGYLLGFESEEQMAGEINVGDVTKRQQQKIEEQMLYIIDLNELVKSLMKEVSDLKEQIQK